MIHITSLIGTTAVRGQSIGNSGERMGARHKLNLAYLNGALAIATIAGLAMKSWGVFWLVVLLVVGCAVRAGNIRPGSQRR